MYKAQDVIWPWSSEVSAYTKKRSSRIFNKVENLSTSVLSESDMITTDYVIPESAAQQTQQVHPMSGYGWPMSRTLAHN